MTARASHSISEPAAAIACVADGGCSYLRALSTIEHLAGFEHTARSYAAAAARCQRNGCWAATANGGAHGGATLHASAPIPLYSARKSVLYTPPAERMAQTIPLLRSPVVDLAARSAGDYIERRVLPLANLSARNETLGYTY